MPHLILEYSKNLAPRDSVAQLLGELHFIVGNDERINIEGVKSRLVEHEIYFVGEDLKHRAFLSLTLKILPGREAKWKKDLGEKLHGLMAARATSWLPASIYCSTTLELQELNAEFYHRTPPPPKS